MKIITRKLFSAQKLKKTLTLRRRKMKTMGDTTLVFLLLSYLNHMKKLGKYATLASVSDSKRILNKDHLQEAHQMLLEKARVKKQQRTLDEMLGQLKRKKEQTTGS